MTSGNVLERRDIPLDEAFRVITDGAIVHPNALQQALFPRLMTQDTGLLIPTGPGAGKLEAIFIPSMIGMRTAEVAHRLFIIAPDGAPLDDYAYRLGPYLRCLVIADEAARTIWFEEPERAPIARKYLPDGSLINGASHHPFSEDVDVIVMPFSHFKSLFFSSGGVHGVPEGMGFDLEAAKGMAPRGLFYFDDSFGAIRSEQSEFIQLVEFLYAQDLDVVVGSSSMPLSMSDEMSFLETLAINEAQRQPDHDIQFTMSSADNLIAKMEQIVRDVYTPDARIAVTLNDPDDTRLSEIFQQITSEWLNSAYLYRTDDSRADRGRVYHELMKRQEEGLGYVVVVDGCALEASDLDLDYVISEPCRPLSLVRRTGRLNRRGTGSNSLLHIVGDPTGIFSSVDRNDPQAISCLEELYRAVRPVAFDVETWRSFCA